MKKIFLVFIVHLILIVCTAQEIFIPRDIKAAYDRGSRSTDGNPGPSYFQNRADYRIIAEFNPESRLLTGVEKIEYHNNSKHHLKYIIIRLYQNIFTQGGNRGREVHPDDTNDGVTITSLSIDGKKYNLKTERWNIYKTQTNVYLPIECEPNSVSKLEIGWEFTMPSKPYERFGCYNDSTFFMGYWFPQVAVLDDINAWDKFDYNSVAEFYNEYGDFDVKIKLPENYIVWSTGTLQNPDDVLQKKYLQRYRDSQKTEETVQIVSSADRKTGEAITPKGRNTWHFKADNVNDFAFGTSSGYLWDASSILSLSGKKIEIHSAYNIVNESFSKVVEIAGWSIKELENEITGIEYPYPSMTVFNGIGGMEYPMIINDHDGTLVETLFVTSHEIAHSYFPFMVGTNQRRHGWFDEGLVTVLGMEVHFKRDSTMNLRETYTDYYPEIAGTQLDIPMLANSIHLSDDLFQLHEYMRPSLAFWTLRDVMGEELFKKCVIEFIRKWEGKHPTPWDFFYTCNNVTGEDYFWFFEPWFNRYGFPDLSIKSAVHDNNTLKISIENTGGMPFPSKLLINYQDGSSESKVVEGKSWSSGKEIIVNVNTIKEPKSIVLDTSGYPDCDEDNNKFEF